jgi:hypothetical protein
VDGRAGRGWCSEGSRSAFGQDAEACDRFDSSTVPGDDEMVLVMSAFSKRGPRWEWLAAMVAWGGCDCAEALRIRKTDVRTWEGKTLVTVRSRRGNRREIPVDGRLEVLTFGSDGGVRCDYDSRWGVRF